MRFLAGIILSLFLWGVGHAEILSIDVHTATLRSAPSISDSYILMKLPKYYPLAVLDSTEDFYKVSDFRDRTGWISKSALDKVPGVVVARGIVNLRNGPGTDSAVTFKAESGVAFKVLEEKGNWVNVLHESGEKGWIYKKLIWGL